MVRLVPRSRFERIESIDLLAARLFGLPQGNGPVAMSAQVALLRNHLLARPPVEGPEWLEQVRRGDLRAMPPDLSWRGSIELAHLVEGYELVNEAAWGDPFRFAEVRLATASLAADWTGGPAELWASLFLEHRRWRMAGCDPDGEQRALLDRLCQRLRATTAEDSAGVPL